MPELPEVETVRLGLAPVLVGNSFASVEQRRADLRFPLPKHFAKRLQGRTVDALDRRAKYLLARLDDGEVLVMHLGMTGRFSIDHPQSLKPGAPFILPPEEEEPRRQDNSEANGADDEPGAFAHRQKRIPKHEHIVFHLADGTAIRYSDTRRFGLMDLIPGEKLPAHALFKGLGVEPLSPDFTAEWLAGRLKGKATSIKAALVDQRLIAGLGNIYACEALFRAGISPLRLAGTLATKTGKPTKVIDAPGQGHKGGARRGDQGRRLLVARLYARRRAARALSAFLQSVRSGGEALSQERLPRHRAPHRPERPLNLLLSELSTIREQDASCLPMN